MKIFFLFFSPKIEQMRKIASRCIFYNGFHYTEVNVRLQTWIPYDLKVPPTFPYLIVSGKSNYSRKILLNKCNFCIGENFLE